MRQRCFAAERVQLRRTDVDVRASLISADLSMHLPFHLVPVKSKERLRWMSAPGRVSHRRRAPPPESDPLGILRVV
jgi:hypothetical protein